MNKERQIGIVFLVLALLVIIGFIVGHPYYWFVLDLVMIIVCGGMGLYLLFRKNRPLSE